MYVSVSGYSPRFSFSIFAHSFVAEKKEEKNIRRIEQQQEQQQQENAAKEDERAKEIETIENEIFHACNHHMTSA